jgi:hypothetical protein
MIDPADATCQQSGPSRRRAALARLQARLLRAIEGLTSSRALAVAFFLLAAIFTLVGWLRPPLSLDLRGIDLPLLPATAGAPSAEETLARPRGFFLSSPGTLLLVLIAAAAVAVLWRPRWLGLAAGLLLGGALVANALLLCNYPVLIELMDQEQDQRQHMVTLLPTRADLPPLTRQSGGRIHGGVRANGRVSVAPVEDQEWGGLSRGWIYLLYAPYLIYLAAAGVLLANRGTAGRRFAWLGAWLGVGLVLALVVSLPRLHAEWHWSQAKALEATGDYGGARQQVDAAVAAFPQMGRMQRTWLLTGRLDYRQHRATPQERFFRAYQYWHRKEWPQALALVAALPGSQLKDHPAMRHLAARIAAEAGVHYFTQNHLAASEEQALKAHGLVPEDRDARLLLGTLQARIDPKQPERVEAALGPLLDKALAEQPLRADTLSLLGNAFFVASRIPQAREFYARSLDLFCLPRQVNFRAARGLGGL